MKLKKILAMTLGTVMAVSTLLTGCGSASKEQSTDSKAKEQTQKDTAQEESKEVKFWTTINNTNERTMYEEMVKRFNEANPDIKVNMELLDGEAYKTKIKTVAASNNLPDVFFYWTGEQFKAFVDSGNVADLTDLYSENTDFKDSFVPGVLDAVTYDNKIYGAPNAISGMVIWYNKKIFKENGVEVPKTYKEFEQVIDTLSAKGVTPISVGSKDRWTLLGWFAYAAQQLGGSDAYMNACKGDGKFTEEPFVKSGEMLSDLSKKGFINGSLALDSSTADSLFAAGKAAMLMTGTWSIPVFTANPETQADYGFFPFPTLEGVDTANLGYLYGGVGTTFAVSNKSKDNESVLTFLKFVMSPEERKIDSEKTGNVSTVKVELDAKNMNPVSYEFNDYVSKNVKGFIPFVDQSLTPDQAEKILNALVAIIATENPNVKEELSKVK